MHYPHHAGSADPMLTTKEAAAYFSLQTCTLEKWRSKNKGPKFIRIGNKSIRYRQSDLDAFLKEGGSND